MKLDLYKLDNEYIDYLQENEKRYRGFTKVSNNNYDSSNNAKPYIGVIFEINEFKYFVPLTHPKTHYDNNRKFFDRISYPIITEKGRDYGRLMFCYMIPVSDINVYERININNIKDTQYKNILRTQYYFINSQSHNQKIIDKAFNLYKKIHNHPNHYLYKYCCAFELLEKISKLY